jgi:hypothetical protein
VPPLSASRLAPELAPAEHDSDRQGKKKQPQDGLEMSRDGWIDDRGDGVDAEPNAEQE